MKTRHLLAISLSLFAASAGAVPEHVENKKFSPTKPPVMDETKPKDTHSKAAWETAASAGRPDCAKGPAWALLPTSKIEATAFKEKTVAVKGIFSRATASARVKGSGLEGQGNLDLASWDSLLAPRDYRVMKYVFGVEEKGASVLPFLFQIAQWTPTQPTWKTSLTLEFTFRGQPRELVFPVTITVDKNVARIVSTQGQRFTFLNAKDQGAFAKLMDLCNHHFLASYADVALDVSFDGICQAKPGE